MSVILKIDEKIQVILGILPEGYSEEEFEKAVNNFLEGFFTASVQACQMSIDQLHAQHGDNLIGEQRLYLEATKLMQSQYKRYLDKLPMFKKKPT